MNITLPHLSLCRVDLKLIFELHHHCVVALFHLIDLLQLPHHFFLILFRLFVEIELHQVLDVVRHLLNYTVQQLYELFNATFYGVLQVDVFLRDVETRPKALLLCHLAIDLFNDSFTLIEPPQLVVCMAERTRQ